MRRPRICFREHKNRGYVTSNSFGSENRGHKKRSRKLRLQDRHYWPFTTKTRYSIARSPHTGWLNFTTVTCNDTRIRTANENSLKRRQFECANLNRRRPTHQAATTGHHGTLYCDTCWFHVATRAPVLNVKIYGRYHTQLIVPSHTTHKSYEVNSTCRTPNYGTWHEDCSSAPCPRCSVLQTGRHVWAPTTLGVQTDGGGAGPVHFNYAWGTRNIMPKRSGIKFSNRNMSKIHIRFCTSSLKNRHHLSHLQASMSIITVDNDH